MRRPKFVLSQSKRTQNHINEGIANGSNKVTKILRRAYAGQAGAVEQVTALLSGATRDRRKLQRQAAWTLGHLVNDNQGAGRHALLSS